jgi:predicted nucleic acid-binding protein
LATERLVVDASAAVQGVLTGGLALWQRIQLDAPTLLWSEVTAALRQLEWRGDIEKQDVRDGLQRLREAQITLHPSSELAHEAWQIAARLGWAKTYDAEYVALAGRLSQRLVTVDARLRAAASSVVRVIDPTEVP